MTESFSRLRKHGLRYFDHAATAQLSDVLAERASLLALNARGNAWRGVYALAEEAAASIEDARTRIAARVGVPRTRVSFVRGVTTGIDLWLRTILATLPTEASVLTTALDHHATLLALPQAHRIPLLSDGSLDLLSLKGMTSPALLVVTAVSNVTGTLLPIAAVREMFPGAWLLVDAAQYVPHASLPSDLFLADVVIGGGHKMYGPSGVAVAFLSERASKLPPVLFGGGVLEGEAPQVFEAGTWDATALTLLADAWEWTSGQLQEEAWLLPAMRALGDELAAKGMQVLPAPYPLAPILSFTHPTLHPHDIASALAERDIAVRAGQLCATAALRAFGVPESGVVRISAGLMTTPDDVAALRSALNDLL